MKFRIILIIFSLFAIFHSPQFVQAHEVENVIHINSNGYEPQHLTIEVGQSVIFENIDKTEDHWPASNEHPTHELYADFDPKFPISPGESWEFAFSRQGRWEYHDHLFPDLEGSITVVSELEDLATNTNNTSIIERVRRFFSNIFSSIYKFFTGIFTGNRATKTVDIGTISDHNLTQIAKDYSSDCDEYNFDCFNTIFKQVTTDHGPVAAVQLLELWQKDGTIHPTVDDHQLVHRIGRETARNFGTGADAFLTCPMSAYNGGCQHGFFEYVLGQTKETTVAAEQICESLGDDYSPKFYFYCYHGVGHGIMMAEAYDLDATLAECDKFDDSRKQGGCWQGAFMEAVNGAFIGEMEGIYKTEQPLEPCATLESRYQQQCFENHAGWLMESTNADIKKATQICLDAPTAMVNTCLNSIGLMVTNPVWQTRLARGREGTFEEVAEYLCDQFPEGYYQVCVSGGVNNLMNFNELSAIEAGRFCEQVDYTYRENCYRGIGFNLQSQSVNKQQVINACNQLDEDKAKLCMPF